ncbi:MAG: hypothetical protein K2N29_03280 [Ruminiclostridium sp.]|nr:hypothetical protein [Ruminiclostridium sp.]
MKKIIIVVIVALAATAALTAAAAILFSVQSFSASTDEEIEEVILPELKEGDYYLNGDKELGVYLHVSGGTISLKGEDLAERFEAQIVQFSESFLDELTPEDIAEQVQEKLDEYTADNEYIVSLIGLSDVPYMVLIAWDKEHEYEDGRYAGYGYRFNGTDTLSFSGDSFGDFILME